MSEVTQPEAAGGKMWSGRFREPLDRVFEQWQRSFPFDWRLFHTEISASIAHARMIEAAGIELLACKHRREGRMDAPINDQSVNQSNKPEED